MSDLVGRLGVADIPLPQPLVEPWVAFVVLVAGVALVVGTRRERLAIAVLLVATVVVLIAYAAAFDSLLGGGLAYAQPRHVLPFALLVPLFAGEVITRRADRLGALAPRRLFVYCALVACVVGVGAFYYVARRYGVGVGGRFLFFLPGQAAWSPPEGWLLLLGMAMMGGILLMAAAIADLRWRVAAVGSDRSDSSVILPAR